MARKIVTIKSNAVTSNFLQDYFNERLEELVKEGIGPEAYEPDYVGNLAKDKADYISEHSKELLDDLKNVTFVFENGNAVDPAKDAITARTLEQLSDHYARHAMVEKAINYDEQLSSDELCLMDYSGTPESFERNREIREKLQGNIVDRTEILTQRLGELLNTDLSEVDLVDDKKLPENIKAMDVFYSNPNGLVRLGYELERLGMKFSTEEEFEEFASRMSFYDAMASLARERTDVIADPEYLQPGASEPAPANVPVLMDKKLSPDERRQKFFEEFDASKSDYADLVPIDPDLVEDFVDDLISSASEELENPQEPEVKAPEKKEPKMKEMSFFKEDGTPDVLRDKLYKNIREIQKSFPDFTMRDDEIDAMFSEKRMAIHQKAVEAQNMIEHFNSHDYVKDYNFPGNSYSVGAWLIDPSGTPEAEEHNRKVMRAFDRSTENMADKAEIFAEALNRVAALDEKMLQPPTPLEDRVSYAADHTFDLMLAWGIRRGLTYNSLYTMELGVDAKPGMREKIDLIGEYGETMGGAKGLLSYAASDEFFTVPDKLTFEQLSVATNSRFTPVNAVIGLAPMANHPSMEEIRKIKIDPTVEGSFFQPKEPSYGRIPLTDLTLVRKELETLTAEFSAAGSKDGVMFGGFSRMKDGLSNLNKAFAEADKGTVITKEASDKLAKEMKAVSEALYAYKNEVEKSADKENLSAAVVKINDLLRDFGSDGSDFTTRIAKINELRQKNALSDERLQKIDQLAALSASQDMGRADVGGVENFVMDHMQWSLNPADTTGMNYGRMKDFADAIVKWNIENTKALGREAMHIKKDTGMSADKASYFASRFSAPGKKQTAITDALSIDRLDSKDFERMCKVFGIKTEQGTLIDYIGEQIKKEQDAYLATLQGEEKEIFSMGIKAADQRVNGFELNAKEGRYMVDYAKGQQEKCLQQVPETMELPSFAAFRDDLKSAASVGTELLGIDRKLHINSGDFRKLKEAVEKMASASEKMEKADQFSKMDSKLCKEASQAMEDVTKAAEKYLVDRWKDRSTDLGKERFAKVAELLSTINPERAAIAESKINVNRKLHNMEPVTFPSIPRNPRPLPPTPHAEPWLPTPEQTVQMEVDSSVKDLIGRVNRALEGKQELYRDKVEITLAEIMLQDMAKREPEKNCFFSQNKFRSEADKISRQPEFKEAVKGAIAENLTELLRSKTLGATVARRYFTNLEKTRAAQKDSLDRSRENIRENAPQERSRSNSVPKKPDGFGLGGM